MSSAENFANSSDPDQAGHFFGPNLDPNCLTLMVFLKGIFRNVDFEEHLQTIKKHAKLPRRQRVNNLMI